MGDIHVNYEALRRALGEFFVPRGEPKIATPISRAPNPAAEVQTLNSSDTVTGDLAQWNRIEWPGYEITFFDVFGGRNPQLEIANDQGSPAIAKLAIGESFRNERGWNHLWIRLIDETLTAVSGTTIVCRVMRDPFSHIITPERPRVVVTKTSNTQVPHGQYVNIWNQDLISQTLPDRGQPLMMKIRARQTYTWGSHGANPYPIELILKSANDGSGATDNTGQAHVWPLPLTGMLEILVPIGRDTRLDAFNPHAANQMMDLEFEIWAGLSLSPSMGFCGHAKYAQDPGIGWAVNEVRGLGMIGFSRPLCPGMGSSAFRVGLRNFDVGGAGVAELAAFNYLPYELGGPLMESISTFSVLPGLSNIKTFNAISPYTMFYGYWSVAPTVTKKMSLSMVGVDSAVKIVEDLVSTTTLAYADAVPTLATEGASISLNVKKILVQLVTTTGPARLGVTVTAEVWWYNSGTSLWMHNGRDDFDAAGLLDADATHDVEVFDVPRGMTRIYIRRTNAATGWDARINSIE